LRTLTGCTSWFSSPQDRRLHFGLRPAPAVLAQLKLADHRHSLEAEHAPHWARRLCGNVDFSLRFA
jgi:hypothetical protein